MKVKQGFEEVISRRINWVLLFFLLATGTLLGKIFLMQVVYHREYVDLASKQHLLVQDIFSERGSIFLKDKKGELVPLALNKIQKNLVVSPRELKKPEEVADFLSSRINIPKEELLAKFDDKENSYKIIAKKLEASLAEEIEVKKFPGVFFEEERRRIYPHDNLGAQLVGFASKNTDTEVGKYGLESFYEKDLSGAKGFFEGVKDAAGSWIALGKRIMRPPKNGTDLVLTIDYNIQFKAEEILKSAKEKWGASSGSVLVLEPKTGKILAMAANPSFNPNEFGKEKNFSVFINPLIESMFELGSVLKPITMAGALAEGKVTPETTYQDPGKIAIKNYVIENFDGKSHGVQTMTQVLEKSLNTGAVFASQLLGHAKHYEYLKKFGFGQKTGIDLPGETPGNLSNLKSGQGLDYMTASFGQGIAVTPLQLAMAIGAVANQGKLMKPYVVEKVIDDAGNERDKNPETVREVISKETAETLTKMLVSVVRNGFDKAGIKGYFVAGKTGTAQIPRKDGRGYSGEVIHTFVGYAPAFDPNFLALIQINEPTGNKFAANTLPPFFHDLAQFILNYYEVPPDEK